MIKAAIHDRLLAGTCNMRYDKDLMNIKSIIRHFRDEVERRRISRLSRGNVRVQKGYHLSTSQWRELKRTHSQRLARLNRVFS